MLKPLKLLKPLIGSVDMKPWIDVLKLLGGVSVLFVWGWLAVILYRDGQMFFFWMIVVLSVGGVVQAVLMFRGQA